MAYIDPNDPATQKKATMPNAPLDKMRNPAAATNGGDFGGGGNPAATTNSVDFGAPQVGAGSNTPAATTNGGNYGGDLGGYGEPGGYAGPAQSTSGSMDDKALRTAMDGGNYGAATTNSVNPAATTNAITPGAAPVTYGDQIAGTNTSTPAATTSPVNPAAPKDAPAATGVATTNAAPAAPAAPQSPAEAAAAGLGWVPPDHPLYGTPGFVGSKPGGGPVSGNPGATTNAPGAAPGSQPGLAATAAAASTVSGTPTAAPLANTTNQGTQDVLRNSLLARATQSTDVNTNDPTFRKVADTYSAGQERSRRAATDMDAERLAAQGMGSSGEMDANRRMEGEKSAQASAGFESQLALSELQNKRSEISSAIAGLGDAVGGDQARALQEKLAQLDATIKEKSLAQTGQLGNADINLRSQLGTGSLNLQGMGLLLQNQQNNNRLGFDIGAQNSQNNNAALRAALGI